MKVTRLTGARVVDPVAGTLATRDVYVSDGVIVEPTDAADAEIDLSSLVLAPSFVDLHGAFVHPERDGGAAVAGGFTVVAASPDHPAPLERPDGVEALLARGARSPIEVLPIGALTTGLSGDDLAEVGLLAAAGCVAVGQGRHGLGAPRVLRHALEYAERLGLMVMLRGSEPELEIGGVVASGPRSIRLGLPGVPAVSEEIGIHRLAALARLTGARVHITHVWSAAGVRALRHARSVDTTITASTTAAHLALDPDATELSPYDGRLRFDPPLGEAADRVALAEALADGTLDAVATDHCPRAGHEQAGTLEESAPGAVMLESAFALTLGAVGGDVVRVARVLGSGPRRVLGLPVLRVAVGEPADLVAVDPEGTTLLDRPRGAHDNTPLAGARLTGRVVYTWRRGELVFAPRSS